jgi:hypothetical protein
MAIALTVGGRSPTLYPGQGGAGGYGGGVPPLYPGQGGAGGYLGVTPPKAPDYTGPGWGGVNTPNDRIVDTTYNPAGVADTSHGYGTAGGTGGGVDWSNLIGGSYEVAGAEAMMGAQMARARTNLQNSLRMNLIDLGIGDKTQLGNLSKYIDKDTLKQAIANKYSVYAQTAENEARANATNDAQLAARGILSSGQTTKSTQDVTNQAESARYSGLREFMRSGLTGLEHMGDVEAQMAQGVMQARFAAAARLAQLYSGAGAGGGTDLGGSSPAAPVAAAPYSPLTDPNFPGGPAAPDYPLVGMNSSAWMNWLKEHGTTGY